MVEHLNFNQFYNRILNIFRLLVLASSDFPMEKLHSFARKSLSSAITYRYPDLFWMWDVLRRRKGRRSLLFQKVPIRSNSNDKIMERQRAKIAITNHWETNDVPVSDHTAVIFVLCAEEAVSVTSAPVSRVWNYFLCIFLSRLLMYLFNRVTSQ